VASLYRPAAILAGLVTCHTGWRADRP